MSEKQNNVIYFQPPGIKPSVCEAGMISKTDSEYIWYLDEPCKILISEVKIIPKENVIYDKKKRTYLVKSSITNFQNSTMEAYEYYKKETGKLYYKESSLELELTDDYINWLERKVVKLFAIPAKEQDAFDKGYTKGWTEGFNKSKQLKCMMKLTDGNCDCGIGICIEGS